MRCSYYATDGLKVCDSNNFWELNTWIHLGCAILDDVINGITEAHTFKNGIRVLTCGSNGA